MGPWLIAFGLLSTLYVYFGYPLLLKAWSLLWPKPVRQGPLTPSVALIIAAHNEEAVLEQKLENSLALDYPPDRLRIIVFSDGSTDRTDEIARSFAERGVILRRFPDHPGKTECQNRVVSERREEVLVFSDANAFYRPDALKKLVRNFADPAVGCVTGKVQFVVSRETEGGAGEGLYERYEEILRRLETRVGSHFANFGTIYAVRREAYRPLPPDLISDFVTPLTVLKQGLRVVYEPQALCEEEAVPRTGTEFRRRIRVVNRVCWGMAARRELFLPWRYGRHSLMLFSHRLYRYLVPLFLLLILIGTLLTSHLAGALLLAGQVFFYGAAAARPLLPRSRQRAKLFYIPFYFVVVNLSIALGVLSCLLGRKYVHWERQRD